jgi:hypothetical protein
VGSIVPRNNGGSDELTNLQALCFRCDVGKRDAGCVFCPLEGSDRVMIKPTAW